jgi:2-oxoglutarate ferredoxin oxidoreductase subunit alpha
VAILAPASPGDCFHTILEAFSLATKYMTPVVVLSDGYLANSAEPWKIPDVATLPRQMTPFRTNPEGFQPYLRDPDTLARPWAIPGTPNLEHRIGGLSKEDVTGAVSYDPGNNERMIQLRAEKVRRMVNDIAPLEVNGANRGELLILGWGGTRGAIHAAVKEARTEGLDVSSAHLRHLNPFPSNLESVLAGFDKVLVPELNGGHLSRLIRAEFLVPAESLNKTRGQPFQVSEILERIRSMLK